MSNLLFFRRSLAYRNAAVEAMRKARAMPPGPERRATRRFARALGDLAKTEAWLEGQTPGGVQRLGSGNSPAAPPADRAVARPAGPAITFQRGLNRAAGGVDGTLAEHHMSSGHEIAGPTELKAVVAVTSHTRTITAPALPRSNQTDATLFDLISQQQ